MDSANRLHGEKSRDDSIRLVEAHPNASVADLLRLLGGDAAHEPAGPLAESTPVPTRRVRAGAPLYHEGAGADAIYFIRSGTFKVFHTAEDGYEQVLGFAGRAEVLGFDALSTGCHPTEAVALEDSTVYVVPVPVVLARGQRIPALDLVLSLALSRALAHQAELADVMAAVAAEVRLARFLMQLSRRMAGCGQSPRRFLLRMSRRDIASHLGVAHETVSRSFGVLVELGCLRVENREVEILDLEGLKALSRSTRRPLDDAGPATGPRLALVRTAAARPALLPAAA